MSTNFIDLTGKQFGKWIVLKRGPNTKGGWIQWICRCECGTIKPVTRSSLRSGRSKGCPNCCTTFIKHGHSRSLTYKVWDSMIQRCTNKNFSFYQHYGGRGITVCQEWKENFINFFNDMGEKPKKLSLDRIDNNKGYFKENCRWVTMKTQNRNRRDSVKIGEIYHSWKLLKRFDDPYKSQFQCIKCGKIIIYCTSSVKTGKHLCHCNPLS